MYVITNIGELVTNNPRLGAGPLGILHNAAIAFDDEVRWVGAAADAPESDVLFDARGNAVIPGFVDSHAHLVFAGDRAAEFDARMSGLHYAAGGIRTTVSATRGASDEDLRTNLTSLAAELLQSGVTHFECKSGYGLSVADELRSIRIAREFTDDTTLLAAHVVPPEFAGDPEAYIDTIINDMLPAAVGIARWVDVFCDKGAFTLEQTKRILMAAQSAGFALRLHANQLGPSAAVDLAIAFDCASADHCSHLSDEQVVALAASNTVATLLPGAEFSTRSAYPSGRALMDAGVTVALATDCNPGSSFTTSMAFCIAVAVREMGFTPAEAVWSATAGGAAALRRQDLGRISPGARADIVHLRAPSFIHLAYRPGVDLISDVWQAGAHVILEGTPQHA